MSAEMVFTDGPMTVRSAWNEPNGCWIATLEDDATDDDLGAITGHGETPEEAIAQLAIVWYLVRTWPTTEEDV
jgi:predicted RNase H-like HicB family nuclease